MTNKSKIHAHTNRRKTTLRRGSLPLDGQGGFEYLVNPRSTVVLAERDKIDLQHPHAKA